MEKPASYFDWEKTFRKKKAKKVKRPNDTRTVNSIGFPQDFFKKYLTVWKSENMKIKEQNEINI